MIWIALRLWSLLGRDPHLRQAFRDQRRATYPNCFYGAMTCLALCDCQPMNRWQFVLARRDWLRDHEGEAEVVPSGGNLFGNSLRGRN